MANLLHIFAPDSDQTDPFWLEAERLAGRILDGRYRLDRLVGVGGTAAVFRAFHVGTQQPVAVKVLLPRSFASCDQITRTLREARMAARLEHPHVVRIRDVSLGRDLPFIVMELLEGESLAARLEATPRLDVEDALTLLLPIVGALACAHDSGIFHRDLKPANVFLARVGDATVPKLLDFGLARGASGDTITHSGTVTGTPSYMSPEQARGEAVGPPSDVWAMGTVLFHCLSGRPPFVGATTTDILLKVVSDSPPVLHHVAPVVPASISTVVARTMNRDPSRRPQSMRVLARLLLEAAAQAGVPVPADPEPIGLPEWRAWHSQIESESRLTLQQAEVSATRPRQEPVREGRRVNPRARLAVLGCAITLLAALAVGLLFARERGAPSLPAVVVETHPMPAPIVPTNSHAKRPTLASASFTGESPLRPPTGAPSPSPAPIARPQAARRPADKGADPARSTRRAPRRAAGTSTPVQPSEKPETDAVAPKDTNAIFELDRSWQ